MRPIETWRPNSSLSARPPDNPAPPALSPPREPRGWNYAVLYVLYTIVLFLGYQAFWVWRSAADVLLGFWLPFRSEWFSFSYLCATLLMGLILFCVVVGAEGYLRNGLDRGHGPLGRLPSRFTRIAATLILSIALALVLQEVILRARLHP